MGAESKRRESSPPPPTRIDDAALVERALDDDTSAATLLYRRHARHAAGLAARLLGRTTDAEDVMHDAFVAAFSTLERLRDPGAFRAWLLRIVVMKARQRLRRLRITRRLGLDRGLEDASLERLASSGVSPEQRAELSLIDDLLRVVPVDERIAWMLAHVEGHTLAEIAELTACSVSTAKRRVRRADRRIGQLVRRPYGEAR